MYVLQFLAIRVLIPQIDFKIFTTIDLPSA